MASGVSFTIARALFHARVSSASAVWDLRASSGGASGGASPGYAINPWWRTLVVPLADRAMGNMKQWLLGTFHGVSRPQIQAYLDEFVFRHNRRGNPQAAFQTLLGLGTNRKPVPLSVVRGATDMPSFPVKV
jgi:hypothetical protein